MKLKAHTFYKTKKNMPGGYFYVVRLVGKDVSFVVTELPCVDEIKNVRKGMFRMNRSDFINIVDSDVALSK